MRSRIHRRKTVGKRTKGDVKTRDSDSPPRSPRFSCLLLHLDAAPEGNMILDVARRGIWIWIIPGSILVLLPIHQQAVIPRLTLPRTCRRGRTGPQVFSFHRALREVNIPLHGLVSVTFCEDFSVPDRLCHHSLFLRLPAPRFHRRTFHITRCATPRQRRGYNNFTPAPNQAHPVARGSTLCSPSANRPGPGFLKRCTLYAVRCS
jgi:hypothetical protein